MQLMTAVSPQLEQLKKEGEAGRRKISQYTRYGTLVLAIVQAIGMSVGLRSKVSRSATISASTSGHHDVRVWCDVRDVREQITERGVGNGISMLIRRYRRRLAGCARSVVRVCSPGRYQFIALLAVGLLAVAIIGFVVFIERGQRRIAVHYAKRQQGR
ncbi:preprotein translocase subunit SecY [Stutzerimonas xanthomarina]|uniref:preprotein translocase subunit SecY n=1 Tax=Stutzerimonas xanthomarina TaxID=271420 RepID=UPI003AA81209